MAAAEAACISLAVCVCVCVCVRVISFSMKHVFGRTVCMLVECFVAAFVCSRGEYLKLVHLFLFLSTDLATGVFPRKSTFHNLAAVSISMV